MAHSGKSITFAMDVFPNEDGIYKLGDTNKKWLIYGTMTGNADTATTLANSRTIWGQSFNGSSNISGNLTGAGPQLKLPSGKTTFEFFTSTSGAANANFGKLGLNSSYASIDLTNYVLDVGGKSRLAGQVFINFSTAASATTKSGQLLITSGTGSNDVALEFYRNSSASWQIINNSGTLRFRNNYVSSAASTYNKEAFSLAYNTGNATFAGTVTASSGFIGPLTGTASGNISNTGAIGDMIYWSAANTPSHLTVGTEGQVLKSSGTAPSWENEYKVEIEDWTTNS